MQLKKGKQNKGFGPIKSRQELAEGAFRMYMGQRQNKEKIAAGDLTEDDIWVMAYDRADVIREEQLAEGRVDETANIEIAGRVSSFRRDQETKYRALFEWNTANDEATLNHILDTEANIYEIRLLLDSAVGKNAAERQKLMTQHAALSDKHKDFLAAAGIDRLTREKKKATNEPFEDWIRIKRLGDIKMQALKDAFVESARASKTEFELKNAIKYHFGYDFSIVNAILAHHRRVLGLDMELEPEKDV